MRRLATILVKIKQGPRSSRLRPAHFATDIACTCSDCNAGSGGHKKPAPREGHRLVSHPPFGAGTEAAPKEPSIARGAIILFQVVPQVVEFIAGRKPRDALADGGEPLGDRLPAFVVGIDAIF
jgi:hypothetical protein